MPEPAIEGPDNGIVTILVPMELHRRRHRKIMLLPGGGVPEVDEPSERRSSRPSAPAADGTLLKALGRAEHWRQALESGAHASIRDLAKDQKINPSYVCRIIRLTLLAPDIVEAILNGRHNPKLELRYLLKAFPVDWDEQREMFQRL